MPWRPTSKPGFDGVDHRVLRNHADLHRLHVEIAEHRIDLRGHEVRGHLMNAGDALRVLRGERGDDGRAVDAEGGERLQVRLDAGAARGVRAGDGERNGNCHRPRVVARPAIGSKLPYTLY